MGYPFTRSAIVGQARATVADALRSGRGEAMALGLATRARQ